MNIVEKRELFDSILNKGQFAVVTFQKKDGTPRTAQVKKWVEKALSSGDRKIVQKNTTDHLDNIYTCCEVKNAKTGKPKYIKVDLNRVITFKGGKVDVQFR